MALIPLSCATLALETNKKPFLAHGLSGIAAKRWPGRHGGGWEVIWPMTALEVHGNNTKKKKQPSEIPLCCLRRCATLGSRRPSASVESFGVSPHTPCVLSSSSFAVSPLFPLHCRSLMAKTRGTNDWSADRGGVPSGLPLFYTGKGNSFSKVAARVMSYITIHRGGG